MLFSFNFQTFILTVCSFFTTFFNFLMSMSVTSSLCCNSQGIAFTSFKILCCFCRPVQNHLSFISTNTVCFSHLLLFKPCVCHTQLFFIANSSSLLLSTFLSPIPYPPWTLTTINRSSKMLVKVPQTESHFTRFCKSLSLAILLQNWSFLHSDLPT